MCNIIKIYLITFILLQLITIYNCNIHNKIIDNKKKPQLIVHIGPSKTASTTLQGSLNDYHDQIVSAGYHFLSKNKGIIHNRVEIDKAFNEFYEHIPNNFFQDAIDNNFNVIISCEYLGSKKIDDMLLYENVFNHFNTTIVMFYRDFISTQISLHYQRRSLDTLLFYISDPQELKLNPITIGANGYLERMKSWNRFDKMIIIDFNGLLAASVSFQYVFICQILNISCNDSSLLINKINNPTTIARINDLDKLKVGELFKLFCDQRGCNCNVIMFQKELNHTEIPKVSINLSHLIKYSNLLDDEFRNLYKPLILYNNKTATLEKLKKYEVFEEVDIKNILFNNNKWYKKFDETLKKQLKLEIAKCHGKSIDCFDYNN